MALRVEVCVQLKLYIQNQFKENELFFFNTIRVLSAVRNTGAGCGQVHSLVPCAAQVEKRSHDPAQGGPNGPAVNRRCRAPGTLWPGGRGENQPAVWLADKDPEPRVSEGASVVPQVLCDGVTVPRAQKDRPISEQPRPHPRHQAAARPSPSLGTCA